MSTTEHYRQTWRDLPWRERVALASTASRGGTGRNRREAALLLYRAQRELGRGPWPALRLALTLVVALLVLQLAMGGSGDQLLALLASPFVVVMLLIPLAAWSPRRTRLQHAVRHNAGVLAGRRLEHPPGAEQVEQLLERARTQGWLDAQR